jgi:hypothetical protein
MQSQITNLGKVAPTFEGAFDDTKPYDRLCCVFDNQSGSSYISRKPVPIGIKIYDINYWQPLSIGSNRIPLSESFGTDSFRSMTQKFLTELWNKQYEFNDTVKDAVSLSQEAIEAIKLLSKDQQEALKLAIAVVDCTNRLTALEKSLNRYSFAEATEDEYEEAKDNNLLLDDTIYFVRENDTSTDVGDDDYA